MSAESSPFGAGADDFFAPDSEMPSFAFNPEFELFDNEDSQNASPSEFLHLPNGNPLQFADPKALLASPPGQFAPAKVSNYSLPSHRGSSSSSCPESTDSSPETSRASGDIMMADTHMGSWKIEDAAAHDSSFNMFGDSMDPATLDMSKVFDFDSASSGSSPSNNAQSTLASPEFSASAAPKSPRVKRHKGHHKAQSVCTPSPLTHDRHLKLTI